METGTVHQPVASWYKSCFRSSPGRRAKTMQCPDWGSHYVFACKLGTTAGQMTWARSRAFTETELRGFEGFRAEKRSLCKIKAKAEFLCLGKFPKSVGDTEEGMWPETWSNPLPGHCRCLINFGASRSARGEIPPERIINAKNNAPFPVLYCSGSSPPFRPTAEKLSWCICENATRTSGETQPNGTSSFLHLCP